MLYVVWTARGPVLVTTEIPQAIQTARSTVGNVSKFVLATHAATPVYSCTMVGGIRKEEWHDTLTQASFERAGH